MSMNLKQYKKVSEDDNFIHLRHEKGHEIKLAHKSLKNDLKKQISELPKLEVKGYAEGGVVDDESIPESLRPNPVVPESLQPTPIADFSQMGDISKMSTEFPEQQITEQVAPQNIDLSAFQKQAPQQVQVPPVDMTAPMTAGLQQMGEGITGEAKALQQRAQAEAKIYQEQQSKQQAVMNQYQNTYNELESERKMLMDDIREARIEPKRYINSMSGSEKVGTVIGLMLGGIGAGLAGGRNPMMDYIDKQIDRDIDAQKANVGKQQNLLSALYHQYGNMNQAVNMAKVFYSDLYSSKIQEAVAKSNNAAAIPIAQKAMGELNMKYGPLIAQNARTNAIYFGNKQGIISAEQSIKDLVPEHMQKAAYEEVGNVRKVQKELTHITESMRNLAKQQTLARRVGAPLESRQLVKSLQADILSKTRDVFGGTMNESEMEVLEGKLIGVIDTKASEEEKIKSIQQLLMNHVQTPILSGHNINYGKILESKNKFKPSR